MNAGIGLHLFPTDMHQCIQYLALSQAHYKHKHCKVEL